VERSNMIEEDILIIKKEDMLRPFFLKTNPEVNSLFLCVMNEIQIVGIRQSGMISSSKHSPRSGLPTFFHDRESHSLLAFSTFFV